MAKPIFYNEVPSTHKLKDDFSNFIKNNPQFSGFIKIGKTTKENLRNRYSSFNEYEKLDQKNVFCECASEMLAFEIERMCQDLWKPTGFLIPGSDGSEGSYSGLVNALGVVYVTKKRLADNKCHFCDLFFTSDMRMEHMQRFHYGKVKELKKKKEEIVQKGLEKTDVGKNFFKLAEKVLEWWNDEEGRKVDRKKEADKE